MRAPLFRCWYDCKVTWLSNDDADVDTDDVETDVGVNAADGDTIVDGCAGVNTGP